MSKFSHCNRNHGGCQSIVCFKIFSQLKILQNHFKPPTLAKVFLSFPLLVLDVDSRQTDAINWMSQTVSKNSSTCIQVFGAPLPWHAVWYVSYELFKGKFLDKFAFKGTTSAFTKLSGNCVSELLWIKCLDRAIRPIVSMVSIDWLLNLPDLSPHCLSCNCLSLDGKCQSITPHNFGYLELRDSLYFYLSLCIINGF